MKLNTKRTVLVGFAFLAISAFWQMYDSLVPMILTGTFKIPETASGTIMAADNILALFLLPLFGGLSDKCQSRLGKRRPFILFGTIFAVVFMMGLPLLDNSYFAAPSSTKTLFFIGWRSRSPDLCAPVSSLPRCPGAASAATLRRILPLPGSNWRKRRTGASCCAILRCRTCGTPPAAPCTPMMDTA